MFSTGEIFIIKSSSITIYFASFLLPEKIKEKTKKTA